MESQKLDCFKKVCASNQEETLLVRVIGILQREQNINQNGRDPFAWLLVLLYLKQTPARRKRKKKREQDKKQTKISQVFFLI